MPTKKKQPPVPPEPPWLALIERQLALESRVERGIESTRSLVEDIRSDNRTTIEAVQATRAELKGDLHQLREEVTARFETLESAVRQNSTDVRELKGTVIALQGTVTALQTDVKEIRGDVREMGGKLEKLTGLEGRVTTLERG